MDSSNILNIAAGAVTLFIILYEFIGARSDSRQPSTLLQVVVTLVAAIIYKLTGHVVNTSLNRSETKYLNDVSNQLHKKTKLQPTLARTEIFRRHQDTIRRNAAPPDLEAAVMPKNKKKFITQLQMD